jgi:hypothetical protein
MPNAPPLKRLGSFARNWQNRRGCAFLIPQHTRYWMFCGTGGVQIPDFALDIRKQLLRIRFVQLDESGRN